MPEATTPAPPDKSKDTIALSAATMGHDLCAALLAELRTMPEHWPKLNEQMQQKIIERLKEKVAAAVHKAQHMLTASEFQAVPAKVQFVNRKSGIRVGLSVAHDALCRHALFDSAEKQVLVVIVDPERWLHRMDELKATGNQADLFDRADANYDPAKDQPGYRRDQDPFAPGISWAEMKAKLAVPPAGDDAAVNERAAQIRELHERLLAAGCDISLGALQARTDEERLRAVQWLAYEKDDKGDTIGRPDWLPEPKKGDSK